MTRVGAAALLILFAQALSACGDADKADVPRGETEEEAGLKREILDVERRLDGLQSKVKEVMEGLKGEDTEEKPSADAAAEKAETPSEELQRVMESLETPIGAEPEQYAAKQGEDARQGEEIPEAPVANGAPEIKPAHPGEEVMSGDGKPEAPVVAASPKILPPLPEERPAQATRKTEPPAEAKTPKARPSQPVEETKKDTQEKAAAEVAKAPAPAVSERNTATLKATAEPLPPATGQEEPSRPRPSIGPVSPAPAPEPAPAVKIIDDLNHFDLGLIEWRQNNLPAAIVHFKAAIASEPANAHAYWNLALVYDQQGEGTKAIRMMEEAEKIYKNFGDQEDMLKARDRLLSWHEKYGDGPGMANRGKS